MDKKRILLVDDEDGIQLLYRGEFEDDGYLVSFIIDENAGRSECILIDCKRFEDGPVCRIALPHKISSGTHACWADRRFLTAEAGAADAA